MRNVFAATFAALVCAVTASAQDDHATHMHAAHTTTPASITVQDWAR